LISRPSLTGQAADLDEVARSLDGFEQARWRHAAPGIAAALTTADAWASHTTAAVLDGVPLLRVPATSCVTLPPGVSGEVAGVHLHRCTKIEPVRAGVVPLSPVEWTAVELAREHGVAAGVIAADYLLHLNKATAGGLELRVELACGWPGVRAARDAIAFADGRSESVLETRSRLLMHRWGIPEPELQVRIGNGWGGFVARVDFYWDEFGVVGEADGAMKYDGSEPAALHVEKKRQEILEQDLDLLVVRWGTADLADFGAIAARLRRKFATGARAPRSTRRWRVLPALVPAASTLSAAL
jgi:hypothetical protein